MQTTQTDPVVRVEQQAVTPPAAAAAASPSVAVSTSLRWGAIFGGAFATLGIAFMLYSLGLALGLSWIDPNDPGSLKPSSIFSAIWLIVVSLIALYVGGYVAARGAGEVTRGFGVLHGLVMWGLSVVAGVWLMGQVASAALSGGAAIGRVAVSAGANMTPANLLTEAPQRMGLTSNALLEPVNQKLRADNKPTVTGPQLEQATRDVLQRAAREGRLDRETFVSALTANTALSRADAEQIATNAEGMFQTARANMNRELSEARDKALVAAEQSSKAFWVIFGCLMLGMLAALGGAYWAGSRYHIATRRMARA